MARLSAKVSARNLGDPFDLATQQGPQIDKAQFDKIMSYIAKGKAQGATVVTGGERHGTKGFFIKPTVFADVRDDMAIACDEIFGPVLSVIKFKEMDEVIRRANTTDYGLAAAVWTRDIGKASTPIAHLSSGPGPSGSIATTSSTPPPLRRLQTLRNRPRTRREVPRQLHRA